LKAVEMAKNADIVEKKSKTGLEAVPGRPDFIAFPVIHR